MIFHLFCVLYVLHLSNGAFTEPSGPQFVDTNMEVLAIDHNFDTLAVATKSQISIYANKGSTFNEALPKGNLLGSISLPQSVDRNPGYLELKLLSKFTVFYCDNRICCLCKRSNDSKTNCSQLDLTFNGTKTTGMQSAAVTRINDDIFLRLVGEDHRAAILKWNIKDITSKSVQYSEDHHTISDQKVVGAFFKGRYVYFVGSTTQYNEPLINARIVIENDPRMKVKFIKLIRICANDQTKMLESRIDIPLNCGEAGKMPNKVAAASFMDDVSGYLYVAVEDGKDHAVCQYDINELDKAFDGIWNQCQKISITDVAKDCEWGQTEDRLKSHCYVLSRTADPTASNNCIRFGVGSDEEFENCELHRYNSTSSRYGHLDSYILVNGKTIINLSPSPLSIASMAYDRENAMFLGMRDPDTQQGIVFRARTDQAKDKHTIVWKMPSNPVSNHSVAVDPNSRVLYLINGTNFAEMHIDCKDLYRTCQDLDSPTKAGWDDPMQCAWCPDEDRQFAVSNRGLGSCNRPLRGICPPAINHANREANHSEWTIFGDNLDRLANSAVFVCNDLCIVNKSASTDKKISCSLKHIGSLDPNSCAVKIVGEIGGHKDFFLRTEKITRSQAVGDGDDPGQSTAPSTEKGNGRAWKAVVGVIASILIIIAIIAIIYYARRFMSKPNKANGDDYRTGLSGSTTTHLLPAQNEYVGHDSFRMRELRDQGNDRLYEQIYKEIEDRLKIDYAKLALETEIGSGHFGTVLRATLTRPDGNRQKVACKMINPGSSSVREFLNEGLIMDRFHHPRVMGLVGIAFTDGKRPIIITEFMPNGDLQTFLKNKENTPTLRSLLQFATEIAEGMEYLHGINFVHRDLAARNCMLNGELHIKIADFGLCRECNTENMYLPLSTGREFPIRWMPPEALDSETFTLQTDVWAYGVVLWELTTRGLTPYGAITTQKLLQLLREGSRLECPPYCPPRYEIMGQCWDEHPLRRPSFTDIVNMVRETVRYLEGTTVTQMNTVYEKVNTPAVHNYINSPVSA